jgi:hypothetical protein
MSVRSEWIDVGTRRKKRWIICALEQLFQDQCPEQLREFVKETLTYLDNLAKATSEKKAVPLSDQ